MVNLTWACYLGVGGFNKENWEQVSNLIYIMVWPKLSLVYVISSFQITQQNCSH